MHLGASHLYALLARLERDGLIAGESQEQALLPPRHVFQLTDSGRAEVVHWLISPFHVRVTYWWIFQSSSIWCTVVIPRGSAIDRKAACRFRRLSRRARTGGGGWKPPISGADATFLSLLRDGRILRTQATLVWLDHCAGLLPDLR